MDRYHQIMALYDSLLTTRYYPEAQRESMLEAMEGKLDRAMYLGHKTLERQTFEVDLTAKEMIGSIKVRFYFDYSPEEEHLALQLLTASVGRLKMTATISGNNLPSFKNVVAQLTRAKRLAVARRVFQKGIRRPDGPTKGKKI